MRRKKQRRDEEMVTLDVRVVDPELAELSARADLAGDRDWFLARPGAAVRRRPATVLERAAYGLPDGTVVTLRRIPTPRGPGIPPVPPGGLLVLQRGPGGALEVRGLVPPA
jgi:hypothetical protein